MGRINPCIKLVSGITMLEVSISILLLSIVSAGVYKTCVDAEITSLNSTNSIKALLAFDGYINTMLLASSPINRGVINIPILTPAKPCYTSTCTRSEIVGFAGSNMRKRLLSDRIGIMTSDANSQAHYYSELTIYWSMPNLGGSSYYHGSGVCSYQTYDLKRYAAQWGGESTYPSGFTPESYDAQQFHTTKRPMPCISFLN